MRFVGIVGAEAAKFTTRGEREARDLIRKILTFGLEPKTVVSGHCHLGGIDIWAEEIADELKIPKVIFPPANLRWEPQGFKERNIKIFKQSDAVHNITVKRYPLAYQGMKFSQCYHCNTKDHVKSGGCWTMHHARTYGRPGILHEIKNLED